MPSIELVTKYGVLGLLETLTIPINCDFKSNFVSREGDLQDGFSIDCSPNTSRTVDRTRYNIAGTQPRRTPNRRNSSIAEVGCGCELRITCHRKPSHHSFRLIKIKVSNKQANETSFLLSQLPVLGTADLHLVSSNQLTGKDRAFG